MLLLRYLLAEVPQLDQAMLVAGLLPKGSVVAQVVEKARRAGQGLGGGSGFCRTDTALCINQVCMGSMGARCQVLGSWQRAVLVSACTSLLGSALAQRLSLSQRSLCHGLSLAAAASAGPGLYSHRQELPTQHVVTGHRPCRMKLAARH